MPIAEHALFLKFDLVRAKPVQSAFQATMRSDVRISLGDVFCS
jgi:hypothetical protein